MLNSLCFKICAKSRRFFGGGASAIVIIIREFDINLVIRLRNVLITHFLK